MSQADDQAQLLAAARRHLGRARQDGLAWPGLAVSARYLEIQAAERRGGTRD